VVVFGPSNFPFAFNAVAGGDFAAAVAAGNPVLAKANPGHPGTSKLFAQCAAQALRASGLPLGTVQLLYDLAPELGLELVGHPLIAAVAFTGSKRAGLTLKAAADRAGKPIYLELSSINPLIVLPGALGERSSAIARELADSCALGAGQFCTKPGLTLLCAGERAERFFEELTVAFAETTPGTLLGPKAPEAIAHAVGELTRHGATIATGGHPLSGSRAAFESTLLRVSARSFLENPGALQTEAFGTVHLVVFAEDAAELLAVARTLEGGLTASIYTDSAGSDDELYAGVEPVLRTKVGRLLNDKMPTGVAVTPAMNHGGPFPATGHPGFTAVGIPASLLRFAALHCYDGVRPERLPEELRDENPTGKMWRLIDGAWSQQNVER
jgi:NADP-dependent aldehyde dehydrogenase